jgi:subtilase family serine protease/PKD repeat protein
VSGIVGLDAARAAPDLSLPAGLSPASFSSGIINPHGSDACAPGVGGTCLTEAQAFNDTYGNFTYVGTGPTDPFCKEYNICDIGNYQFLMPQTIPKLVGAHDLWNGTGTVGGVPDTGQGITVAVVEVGCMDAQTLQNYSEQLWGNANQVTGRFTQIALSGVEGPQTTLSECLANATANGWEGETALDIEYIAAMAPSAHIDLVGVPDSSFDSFDQAYQFIATYLSTGEPCPASFGSVANFVGTANDTGACSVTIDSNSYGTGEAYIAFEGVPIYLNAENQLLNVMSLEGITNFFASGDYSAGGAAWGIVQADMPSIATGAISVGGGQLTAMAPNGEAFEDNNFFVPMCTDWEVTGCLENLTINVTPTAGIYSYTYWAAYCDYGPIYCGYVGGGHGPSETLATPWWENANDTYTTGVKVDPEISNAAAFNMTIWAPESSVEDGWEPTYGGTSFACPISAGEWALLEEQALAAGDISRFGDINALLFSVHNAAEASVSYAATSPFYPMGLAGTGTSGFTTANWDSMNWYYYNLSMVQSPGTNLPPWAFSAYNPAGPLWNFLGGIGMILAPEMVASVVGSTHTTPSVLNSRMSVVEVSGLTNVPVTELKGGTTYDLAVVNSTTGIPIPNVKIWAYSGCTNSGTYGGGTTTFISSSTGAFTYTPVYAPSGLSANYTEYAYFKAAVTPVGPGSQWAFNAYAVVPPTPVGNLVLAVDTPIGTVTSGAAEVSSFAEFDMSGWYVEGSTAQVLLNGMPAPGAVVTETSVNWNWSISEMSTGSLINATAWAPGTLVSNWIADSGGQVTYFTNGFTAEYYGTIPPQVFELQATYDGLTSAPVIVYVEPQFGLFQSSLKVIPTGTGVAGNVSFVNMKYLTWLNVSVGGGPGQFENFSCLNDASFCSDQTTTLGNESSLMSGTLPITLSLPSTKSPMNVTTVTLAAAGNNTLYETFTQPLWVFQINFPGKLPAPGVSLKSVPSGGVVSGTVSLTYSSTWNVLSAKLNGAVGTLSEVWSGGSAVLASGTNLVNNGSSAYLWNTASTPAGYVWITLSVETPAGVFSNASITFYVAKPMVTVSPSSLYTGQDATFTAWSEGGSGLTYFWSFGDGARSATVQPVYAYPNPGTYNVDVYVNDSSGISVSESTVVTVQASGVPVITVSTNPAYAGQAVDFSVSVPPGSPLPPLTYSWSFGDGAFSTLTAPAHVYTTLGTYSVTVWENGTGNGVIGTMKITVSPAPAPVVYASVNPAYVGQPVNFSLSISSGGPQPPITYFWSFGDGTFSTLTAPAHTYAIKGSYTVTVWENGTGGAGVVGTMMMTVNVAGTPSVYASTSSPYVGQAVDFSVSVPPGAPQPPLTYSWLFGDGASSTLVAPSHAYANKGTYSVTVWENGTGADVVGTLTMNVSAAAAPVVYASANPVFTGEAVSFSASVAAGAPLPPLTYSWSFGDGTFSALTAPSHEYVHAGTYGVTVWENGTGAGVIGTLTMTVEAVATPVVSASSSTTDVGQLISFSLSQPTGAPVPPLTYEWHFGDGGKSTAEAPQHAYLSAGTYSVTGWENGTGGFGIVGTSKVAINPPLSISVSISPSGQVAGQSIIITTTVSGGTGTITVWYNLPPALGCPTSPSGTQVTCTPATSGDYSITVGASDGVNSTTVQVASVTISPQPSTTTSGSSTNWQILVIAVLVVAAVLLGLLYAMERNKKNPGKTEPSSKPEQDNVPSEEEGDKKP